MTEEEKSPKDRYYERTDRPLEGWELHNYRNMQPRIMTVVINVEFFVRLWRIIVKTAACSVGVFGAIYTFHDVLWRIAQAIMGH